MAAREGWWLPGVAAHSISMIIEAAVGQQLRARPGAAALWQWARQRLATRRALVRARNGPSRLPDVEAGQTTYGNVARSIFDACLTLSDPHSLYATTPRAPSRDF